MANIKLSQIRKKFGATEIIHGIDLDIKQGEFVVFVGPSGCGKSTLLRLIAGLEEITDGILEIDNVVSNHIDPAERGIAMVFQTYALYPHLTVRENMGFGMKMNGVAKAKIDQRVNAAATSLQLGALLDRKPKTLSGGQRQRVAIGRAIVRNPKVFLFDEPLSNLDAELRVDMRVEIARLHRELAATMIYVTHDQVEAMTLADKIVVLRDGHIEQVGSPLELYHHPANEFVAGFIGSPKMNLIPAVITALGDNIATLQISDGNAIEMSIDTASIQCGDHVRVGIRPEHVTLGAEGEISLTLTTHASERLGASTYLFGQVCGDNRFRVHVSGDADVKLFEDVVVNFDRHNCHVFFKEQCISNRQLR